MRTRHQHNRIIAIILCIILLTGCFSALADDLRNMVVPSAGLEKNSAAKNGMVRVFLSSMGNPSTLNLTTQGSYCINGNTGRTLPGGSSLTVKFHSASGSLSLSAGGSTYQMGDYFILRRTSTSSSNSIKIRQSRDSGNPYPGDLSFRAVRQSGGGYKLYTVAHVYIEDYLYGVLPYEMGNASAIEALKAQAVAARTYTVRMMQSRASGYYDVVDTTSDQVYRGTPSGNANCVEAVNATKGIVLTYNGKYALTYYSASNGGQTESLKNVEGNSSHPYLMVKEDPFDYSNPSSLVRTNTIYADLRSGKNSSAFLSLLKTKTVSALKKRGYNATSSNTKLVTLKSISAHTPKYPSPSRLYTKMDFSLTATTGNGVTAEVTVTFDIFSELESLFSMSIQSASNELWDARQNGDKFILEARRYGHGYGMSQRGAMYMGKLGYSYDRILGFYYEGCARTQQSFTNTVLDPVSGGNVIESPSPVDAPESVSSACSGTVKLISGGGVLAVRKEKTNAAELVGTLGSGAVVSVMYNDGSWCYISYGLIKGYVPSSSLSIVGTPSGEAGSATDILGFATVTANHFVNLRSGPAFRYDRVTTAPTGSVLIVFSVSGDWARVQYESTAAYVNTSYISAVSNRYPHPISETMESGTAEVITASGTGTVNLRETASTSARVMMTIPVFTLVTVLSDNGVWAQVRYGDQEGYMMSQFLRHHNGSNGESATQEPTRTPELIKPPSIPDGKTVYITANQTPLYERAQEESPRLTMLSLGTQAMLLSYESNWSFIRVNGYAGYVLSTKLSETKPTVQTPEPAPSAPPVIVEAPSYEQMQTARVIASGSLNLRIEPRYGSQILTTIPYNTVIAVYSYGAEWCAVHYNGISGYVMTSFLLLEQPSEPTPAPGTATPSQTQTPTSSQGKAIVTTVSGALNLRKEAGYHAAVVFCIPQYAEVEVLTRGESWTKVRYLQTEGYVVTSYLTFVDKEDVPPTNAPGTSGQSETAWVSTPGGPLNLRERPNSSAPVLLLIPTGAQVTVHQRRSDWCQVTYRNVTGYVMTSFMYFSSASASPEPQSTPPSPAEETPAPTATDAAPAPAPTATDAAPAATPTATEAVPEPTPTLTPSSEPTVQPTNTPAKPSTEMEVLQTRRNAMVNPAHGETCNAFLDCRRDSAVVKQLSAGDPVLVWMLGSSWCLIQYDLTDESKLAYCLTDDLQMTGE